MPPTIGIPNHVGIDILIVEAVVVVIFEQRDFV
jgi:hypothetical protein